MKHGLRPRPSLLVIEIKNISGSSNAKDTRVLDEIHALTRARRAILGIVGNRAGPGINSLLRILGPRWTRPPRAMRLIAGYSVNHQRAQVRPLIGYLPAALGVYADQPCAENLALFAACYGIPARERPALVSDYAPPGRAVSRAANDPGGGSEPPQPCHAPAAGLARALVHDPQLVIVARTRPMPCSTRAPGESCAETPEGADRDEQDNRDGTSTSLAKSRYLHARARPSADGRLVESGTWSPSRRRNRRIVNQSCWATHRPALKLALSH
jgi:hypothetical protein